MDSLGLVVKATKVIQQCNTSEQLEVAKTYVERVMLHLGGESLTMARLNLLQQLDSKYKKLGVVNER